MWATEQECEKGWGRPPIQKTPPGGVAPKQTSPSPASEPAIFLARKRMPWAALRVWNFGCRRQLSDVSYQENQQQIPRSARDDNHSRGRLCHTSTVGREPAAVRKGCSYNALRPKQTRVRHE